MQQTFGLIGKSLSHSFSQKYFNDFFEKLAGTAKLRTQIVQNSKEQTIRDSWEAGITKFKKIRKKYLLYSDFE